MTLAALMPPGAEPTVVIPVTCDRCRAIGRAGTEDFAELKELLDFTPVPRFRTRVDGWSPERQKAFIVALAGSGSPRRAAHSIGMAAFGAEQLRKADNSESFNLAWERALVLHEEQAQIRLAQGMADAAAAASRRDAPRRGRPPGARPTFQQAARIERQEQDDAAGNPALLDKVLRVYVAKLCEERRCRLEGRIAAADFALRQLTCIEIVLDTASGDVLAFLREASKGGHKLLDIADTEGSRLLDSIRREHWRLEHEPPRPDPIPDDLVHDHGTHRTYIGESIEGGSQEHRDEQIATIAARHRRDAAAVIRWEAEARAEWERRHQPRLEVEEKGEH